MLLDHGQAETRNSLPGARGSHGVAPAPRGMCPALSQSSGTIASLGGTSRRPQHLSKGKPWSPSHGSSARQGLEHTLHVSSFLLTVSLQPVSPGQQGLRPEPPPENHEPGGISLPFGLLSFSPRPSLEQSPNNSLIPAPLTAFINPSHQQEPRNPAVPTQPCQLWAHTALGSPDATTRSPNPGQHLQ